MEHSLTLYGRAYAITIASTLAASVCAAGGVAAFLIFHETLIGVLFGALFTLFGWQSFYWSAKTGNDWLDQDFICEASEQLRIGKLLISLLLNFALFVLVILTPALAVVGLIVT